MDDLSEKLRIKRGDLIGAAGALVGGAAVGRAVGEIIRKKNADPLVYKESSQLLQATATAVVREGKDTSFQEKGGFTKEIFERVRNSTFMVEVGGMGIGTAWLAKREGDSLYFVVNRHELHDSKRGASAESFSLWRPRIDKEKFTPSNFPYRYYAEGRAQYDLDLAVVKCEDTGGQLRNVEPLPWKDNVIPKKGTNLLIVGFPGDFHTNDYKNALTLGSVLKSEGNFKENDWFAHGVVNGGSSGSPAVILDNKKPVVVGIVYARVKTWTHEVICIKLDITPLIESLD